MLGKLIKYEWKDTCKMGGLMLLAVAGVTLIGALGFILPCRLLIQDSGASGNSVAGTFWAMLMMMSLLVYVVMLIGVSYGMIIYQGVHFYKTMYSDEGYLTQTLPVSARQLLVSKTLVAGLWQLFVGLSVFLSAAILIFAMLTSVLEGNAFWREMEELQRELDSVWDPELSLYMARSIIEMIALIVIGPFSTMLVLFGSLTIGQLANKYKALIGILAYFGSLFVTMIVSYVVQFLLTFQNVLFSVNSQSAAMTPSYEGTLLVNIIMGAGMYGIAYYILTRKLNMD